MPEVLSKTIKGCDRMRDKLAKKEGNSRQSNLFLHPSYSVSYTCLNILVQLNFTNNLQDYVSLSVSPYKLTGEVQNSNSGLHCHQFNGLSPT